MSITNEWPAKKIKEIQTESFCVGLHIFPNLGIILDLPLQDVMPLLPGGLKKTITEDMQKMLFKVSGL